MWSCHHVKVPPRNNCWNPPVHMVPGIVPRGKSHRQNVQNAVLEKNYQQCHLCEPYTRISKPEILKNPQWQPAALCRCKQSRQTLLKLVDVSSSAVATWRRPIIILALKARFTRTETSGQKPCCWQSCSPDPDPFKMQAKMPEATDLGAHGAKKLPESRRRDGWYTDRALALLVPSY